MTTTVITLEAAPKVGGVATYLAFSLEAASAYNLPVRLAAPRGATGADIPLPCDSSDNLFNLHTAACSIKKLTSDTFLIAEAAALKAVLTILPWVMRQKIRILLHGSEVLELAGDPRLKKLLHHAEKIYTLSHFVATIVEKNFPGLAHKIVITGGAPSPRLTIIDGLKNPHRLLTVARLHPRKGQGVIINAIKNGQLPDFSYDIVGPTSRGGYAAELIKNARSLPVHFHGSVDDSHLSVIHSQCGIFVLPALAQKNRIEGYGLALVDAIALGCVPVAYDCGGISEVIRHCRTGFVIPEGDTKAFIDTLHQLSRDDALRAQMIVEGRAWAANLSWRRIAQLLFT